MQNTFEGIERISQYTNLWNIDDVVLGQDGPLVIVAADAHRSQKVQHEIAILYMMLGHFLNLKTVGLESLDNNTLIKYPGDMPADVWNTIVPPESFQNFDIPYNPKTFTPCESIISNLAVENDVGLNIVGIESAQIKNEYAAIVILGYYVDRLNRGNRIPDKAFGLLNNHDIKLSSIDAIEEILEYNRIRAAAVNFYNTVRGGSGLMIMGEYHMKTFKDVCDWLNSNAYANNYVIVVPTQDELTQQMEQHNIAQAVASVRGGLVGALTEGIGVLRKYEKLIN